MDAQDRSGHQKHRADRGRDGGPLDHDGHCLHGLHSRVARRTRHSGPIARPLQNVTAWVPHISWVRGAHSTAGIACKTCSFCMPDFRHENGEAIQVLGAYTTRQRCRDAVTRRVTNSHGLQSVYPALTVIAGGFGGNTGLLQFYENLGAALNRAGTSGAYAFRSCLVKDLRSAGRTPAPWGADSVPEA